MVSTYKDNILNKYDNWTYNWKIKIINPELQGEDSLANQPGFILAQTGVENEISIEGVVQDYLLGGSEVNRQSQVSMFNIALTEANGLSLFTRIKYAAEGLGVPNIFDLLYVIEFKIMARRNGIESEPIEVPDTFTQWVCSCINIQHDYASGAGSNYQMVFYEENYQSYETPDHIINSEINVSAQTIGEFAQKLQRALQDNEDDETRLSLDKSLPTQYKIEFPPEWQNYTFSVTGSVISGQTTNVSNNGSETSFDFVEGTSVTRMMATAITHTTEFRNIPTNTGGFCFDGPDTDIANPDSIADFPLWFYFDNLVKYRDFDVVANTYQRETTIRMVKYILPELICDNKSHRDLLNDLGLQRKRIRNYVLNNLLEKRYDWTYTGLNTEVLDLSIQLNQTYRAIRHVNNARYNGQTAYFSNEPGESTNDIQQLNAERSTAEQQSRDQQAAIESGQLSTLDEITANNNIRQLESAIASLDQQINELSSNNTYGVPTNINGDRYITQSDLTRDSALRNSSDPITKNMRFVSQLFRSISSDTGPDEQNSADEVAAARLGAIEITQSQAVDLMNLVIGIKGDPYWLGRNGIFANGGPALFLNVNLPSYTKDSDTTAEKHPDWNISGLYRVFSVQSRCQNGQWVMYLKAFRDVNSDITLIYDDLETGEIRDDVSDIAEQQIRFQEEDTVMNLPVIPGQ